MTGGKIMNSALILIDIQNEYFRGGKRELPEPQLAAQNARRALEFFRSKGLPVFHVRHNNLGSGSASFLPGSFGAEIHGSVKPVEGETVVVKHYPSAFLQTGLADLLREKGVGNLVVCGMMSHMCIDTSVRAAQDYDLPVIVLDDACATRDLAWAGETVPAHTVHNTIMAALNGTFARVMQTEEFFKGEYL
jgi:nicotinamidase-related amidase